MQTVKRLTGWTALTLLIGVLLAVLIGVYYGEYKLFSMKPETATTIGKFGEKGLFNPPSYFMEVEMPDGEVPYQNRITKKQIHHLENGVPVNGYSSGESDFSTLYDIAHDSFFFFIAIFLFAFTFVTCVRGWIGALPEKEKSTKQKRKKTKQNRGKRSLQGISKKERKRLKREKERKKERFRMAIAWSVLGAFSLTYLFVIGRVVLNMLRKVLPFGKTETEAQIVDRYYELSHRRYKDSEFEFNLSFEDTNGQKIHLTKNVTPHTYEQFQFGDTLPIEYRNANPYDVFVRSTSFTDIMQIILTWQGLVLASITGILLYSLWIMYKEQWKKR